MQDTERNGLWERYWHALPDNKGIAVWDSDPELNAAVHLSWFRPYFRTDLPLIDLGCGNGTQTAFLARHYAPVLGLDVSPTAVDRAARAHSGATLSFRQFDVVDTVAGAALHAEFGDCNVYVRTLLHLLSDDARKAAVQTIAALLGKTGGLFIAELAHSSIPVFEDALALGDESVPKIRHNLRSGIVGANLLPGELEKLLSGVGIRVIAQGEATMLSTDRTSDGAELVIPLDYVLGGTERHDFFAPGDTSDDH
ncbi:class I SAM-dependent methyltransferase [Nocardia brasiliensis]|uniref:class I SAM-dependent methyltransferase n=1 Tax=Nocardia brasiliensis TaxID=37326 RepID=UPI002453A855|nr:class I SAM-dependent methyltransferase [Nocardia brasiliensis]